MRALSKLAWLLPGLGFLTSCSEPVGLVFADPTLEALEARAFAFRFEGTWGLLVEGVLSEDEPALVPNMRLRLKVSTTSGDEEDLTLRSRVCESESAGRYLCNSFLLSMRPGRHVEELLPHLSQLHGGLAFVGMDGSWANAWLFEGEAGRAMDLVRNWPGVQSASHDGLALPAGGPPPPPPGKLVVNVSPVSFDPPQRGDGTVQVRSGDVVTVTYSDGDGANRIASFTMCEEPAGYTGTPIVGLGPDPTCG